MKRSLSLPNFRNRLPILHNIDDILRASKNNIILFGSVGNGKTSLLNKLCDQNYPTADEGYSCTKNVQYSFSRICDMIIVDFPGLNATKDFIYHLKVHKEALSSIPVKMICFVVKHENRNDLIVREIDEMLEIFDDYTENIALIMTNTEGISETRKEDIKYIFKNEYQIENVLFTEKLTNGYSLCLELYKIQQTMKNIDFLRIKTNNLAKHMPSRSIKEIVEKQKIFEQIFNESLSKFKMEVEKAKDDDLIRALYFCFKDYKDILYDQYAETLKSLRIKGKEIDEAKITVSVLQFTNKIYNDFNDFKKYIESKLEVKLNNYNGEFNKFKKCPHCGLIWFKVVGCDSVQCGKRTSIKDKYFGIYKKYKVRFDGKVISISSNDVGDNNVEYSNEFYGLTDAEKADNLNRKLNGKIEISPMGCGRTCRWNEMEDCSEEVIKKLQKDSLNDDYYSGFFEFTKKI